MVVWGFMCPDNHCGKEAEKEDGIRVMPRSMRWVSSRASCHRHEEAGNDTCPRCPVAFR